MRFAIKKLSAMLTRPKEMVKWLATHGDTD